MPFNQFNIKIEMPVAEMYQTADPILLTWTSQEHRTLSILKTLSNFFMEMLH